MVKILDSKASGPGVAMSKATEKKSIPTLRKDTSSLFEFVIYEPLAKWIVPTHNEGRSWSPSPFRFTHQPRLEMLS